MNIKDERQKQQIGHRKRLRQKLLSKGNKGLLDYEILELILCSAHPRKDVKPIAKKLIEHFGTFAKVFFADYSQLKQISGIGEVAISAIFCIREALNRILRENIDKGTIINQWQKLIEYLRIKIGNGSVENFHILYLNTKYKLLADETQDVGTVNQTPLYVREIIKKSLFLEATSIIIAHNHPSGDAKPSKADIEITNQLARACSDVGITLIDHVIVTSNAHYSFKTHNLL
ncbi:DNA repair RadC family protein [Ehrlichia chaffeensis str. Heartland]|uniref:DNA repair protein RadC n=1 Tax=Ehrlichia chaffeensis (strain ATCC CRL-10679 / Arkansas) TaxID=205920 RepID=Q2GHA0_EHRCR|nr:DNA repair protein RadC [Ehrlichia chaffeensis]ABD45356.1 DNA repair protein RadC [Ehrlichia chaffeensis str. Arkansas]AHX03472.1 DNA repair RadC family protein [Ehrlichia chaffeensis str. Heartland]AHX05808.1 DNA repair RadC family protein [Ehrlichia chaffeensis str. Jax]AHX06800.1 DNA repair RadC family protein [Ehrlichia chaffeensis str. Liberty]AHX07316.1 DNA repair RadC family protein [Ehrlichia chaffeensis str. Osceola]